MNCPVKTYLSAMKNSPQKSGRNDRKQIWNWSFMRRMQGRKGLSAASLRLKTFNDNP